MKKIIALLLALIMTFSVATVAFAEDVTDEPAEETILTDVKEFLGEYEWILDLPAGVIPPALKLAKIAEENEDLKNILDNINIPTTAAPEVTA